MTQSSKYTTSATGTGLSGLSPAMQTTSTNEGRSLENGHHVPGVSKRIRTKAKLALKRGGKVSLVLAWPLEAL